MRTQEQYLADLAKMRPNLYIDGKQVDRTHPMVIKGSQVIRYTFALADNPEYEPLLTTTSHISGKKINRFTHIHQSPQDLLDKQEMTRKMCNMAGGCIQRCMGCDMLNGISAAALDVDKKHGTHYYDNFMKYLEFFQENDLVAGGAQTDTKGDRAARPAQQWDPDQYLHVVERRPDGVVVRGCKVHNTMAPVADEIIVVPTRVMMEDEKDYAISFAIPADTEGLHLIVREAFSHPREDNLNAPFANIGDLESMTVFDDVFVPNERIFLNGEYEFAGNYALNFALFHRHSYTGCKPGIGDIITGTVALLADYQNVARQGHVKEKLADLISVAELVYAAGIAAGYKSTKASSGTQMPNVVFANVGRRHAGHNVYHELNVLADVAGGLSATLPMSAQWNSPLVGDYVKKYVTRKEGVSSEDNWRAFALASDILTGEYGQVMIGVAGVHGGGSPVMEDIAIMKNYDLKGKMQLAKNLAGIKT
ncbi:MAG: aromatic ring hydroxylase [Ruminococcaceae bacterium]|nr:aromatic ring hydroxylase [Oscillospiraceae bacterium]